MDHEERQRLAVNAIQPKSPGLIGEDPYDAEVVSLEPPDEQISIFVRGPSLLLDPQVVGPDESTLRLRRPKKIEIKTD